MAQGYVYDPSQQISQSFQQAGQGIGNIFTTIVQQKQRDYTLAENAFNNIEALKKNLNIYGQKNITDKSNALLKEASSAIFADGKIDYSKLGEIRQKVSDINDLKQGYDLGAKEFERMVQLGVANKDNLVSFEKFYKDLSAKMADENLIKNPQDLQRQMTEAYTNNLDANKMFMKTFLAANPMQKISKTVDVTDAKGKVIGKNFIQAEVPAGITFDAKGNKIIDPNLASKTIAYLQQANPELLALMKKNAGVAGDMLSDEQLVSRYINNVPTAIMAKEEKSALDLRGQEAKVKADEFTVAHQDEILRADLASKYASANYYNRKGQEETAQNYLEEASKKLYTEDIKLTTGKNIPLSAISLGKPMKLDIGNQQAIVGDIAISKKSGDIWVKAKVDKNGNFSLDENQLTGGHTTWRKVKNNDTFRKAISSAIELSPRANRPKLQAKVNLIYDYANKQQEATPSAPAQAGAKKHILTQEMLDEQVGPNKQFPTKKAAYDYAVSKGIYDVSQVKY